MHYMHAGFDFFKGRRIYLGLDLPLVFLDFYVLFLADILCVFPRRFTLDWMAIMRGAWGNLGVVWARKDIYLPCYIFPTTYLTVPTRYYPMRDSRLVDCQRLAMGMGITNALVARPAHPLAGRAAAMVACQQRFGRVPQHTTAPARYTRHYSGDQAQ